MGGRIEVLNGVVADTGKKFYRDKTINAGTRSVFDMAVTSMGGGKDVSAGAEINDLTYNDYNGTFAASKVFSNGGMEFAGVKGDGFDLEASSSMKVADTHWLFTAWMKITLAGSVSSFNNQTIHFSTANTNGATTALLSLVPTLNSSGVPTTIELAVRGKNYVLSTQVLPLYDGNVHQFAVELSLSADGATQTLKVYIDKSMVYSNTGTVATTPPGEPTVRRIGTTASLPLSWKGKFYRSRVDIITVSGLTVTEILTSDYNLCASRFS